MNGISPKKEWRVIEIVLPRSMHFANADPITINQHHVHKGQLSKFASRSYFQLAFPKLQRRLLTDDEKHTP